MPRQQLTDEERARGAALGRRLRDIREEVGLSGEQLARQAEISVETLRRLETGRVGNPGVFTVTAIAQALGTDLPALLKDLPRHSDRSAT